jgi:hypothetical protein
VRGDKQWLGTTINSILEALHSVSSSLRFRRFLHLMRFLLMFLLLPHLLLLLQLSCALSRKLPLRVRRDPCLFLKHGLVFRFQSGVRGISLVPQLLLRLVHFGSHFTGLYRCLRSHRCGNLPVLGQ